MESEVSVSVHRALSELERYIRKEEYRGYDPYRGLASPEFALPVLPTNKTPPRGTQQILRRLPVNIPVLIGIKRGYNPPTLGLCLQAYTNLVQAFPEQHAFYEKEITFCVDELERLPSRGYSGACCGYEFNWENRYARNPTYTLTIVATGFITNALLLLYTGTGITTERDLCISATEFVNNDLAITESNGLFCYSYSPMFSISVLASHKLTDLGAQTMIATSRDLFVYASELTSAWRGTMLQRAFRECVKLGRPGWGEQACVRPLQTEVRS